MARFNYDDEQEHKQIAFIKGVKVEFYDSRLERESIPEGKYYYEIAGDDDCGDIPCRVTPGVLVNFYGSIVCDAPLSLEDSCMYLEEDDFQWERRK